MGPTGASPRLASAWVNVLTSGRAADGLLWGYTRFDGAAWHPLRQPCLALLCTPPLFLWLFHVPADLFDGTRPYSLPHPDSRASPSLTHPSSQYYPRWPRP